MKYTSLELLCCPTCHSELKLHDEASNGFVVSGDLLCLQCKQGYPIEDGIVRFIDSKELDGTNRHFEHYYNRLAPFYSLFTKVTFLVFGGEQKARKEILDRLNFNNNRTLEVSIGNGVNLPFILDAQNPGEVYGLDISIGQLSRCRSLTSKNSWQVDLFLGTAESLPFKADTFDNILHIGGINFFSDKKQAIKEMIRVARPGSKIVIADEVERLAKRIFKSVDRPSTEERTGEIETTIINDVPKTMENVHVDGIWKAHGKHHGYCLEFTKPS